MNWGNLIAGGAITGMLFGVITACWTRVKGFFWRLFAFVIQHVDIRDDHSSQAVLTYLLRDYKRSRFYDKTYGGAYEFTREGKYGIVAFEFFGGKADVDDAAADGEALARVVGPEHSRSGQRTDQYLQAGSAIEGVHNNR